MRNTNLGSEITGQTSYINDYSQCEPCLEPIVTELVIKTQLLMVIPVVNNQWLHLVYMFVILNYQLTVPKTYLSYLYCYSLLFQWVASHLAGIPALFLHHKQFYIVVLCRAAGLQGVKITNHLMIYMCIYDEKTSAASR